MLDLGCAPLESILERSSRAVADRRPLDFHRPVDRNRWWVCPTLTPLYYAPIYQELSDSQQLRYNQLAALSFSELIGFFEASFAASLEAVARQLPGPERELADCLHGFLADERLHGEYWQGLNAASEPSWYSELQPHRLVKIPRLVQSVLALLTRRPTRFPVVFWVMLTLEERSLEISRRCLRMPADEIDPHYREVYRRHLIDEVRHVQLDCHLIERYFAPLAPRWRKLNARLLRTLVDRFLLPPNRTAVRVVEQLLREHPGLRPRLPELRQQLRQVGNDPEYHALLFSRETTPLLFERFDRHREMHTMEMVLESYRPREQHP